MNKVTNNSVICVHIPAAEGEPSTFWKSATGKYYRTKSEALKDSGKTYNPDDYRIVKNFFVKYKYYILAGLVAAALATAMYYFAPKIVAKFKK